MLFFYFNVIKSCISKVGIEHLFKNDFLSLLIRLAKNLVWESSPSTPYKLFLLHWRLSKTIFDVQIYLFVILDMYNEMRCPTLPQKRRLIYIQIKWKSSFALSSVLLFECYRFNCHQNYFWVNFENTLDVYFNMLIKHWSNMLGCKLYNLNQTLINSINSKLDATDL